MRTAVATLVLLVGGVGCYSVPKAPPPLRVSRAELGPIARLCLLPIESDVEGEEARVRFQQLLVRALAARHFATVEPETTRSAFDRLAREQGGYFDVHSGEPVADYARVAKQVKARVGAELGCQALVQARIAFVIAPWEQATANWDGASVGIGGGVGALGTIGALSLHLRILDLDERELFFGTGGIRPTASLDTSLFSSRFETLPEEQLLADAARNRMAIDLALQGWPARPQPDPR